MERKEPVPPEDSDACGAKERNYQNPEATKPHPNRMVIQFGGVKYVALPENEYLELVRVATENVAAHGNELKESIPNIALEYGYYMGNLSYWRRRAGISQLELAKQVGVSQSFLGQVETGKKHLNVQLLTKLSAVLKVPMELLAPPPNHMGSKVSPAA